MQRESKLLELFLNMLAGRDSEVDIATATGCTVRGSNPGGCDVFRTHQNATWVSPSLLYNGYYVINMGKAAGTFLTTHPI
jgi:hypothetical protein